MVLECHSFRLRGGCIVTGGLGFLDLAVGGCGYWGCWFGNIFISVVTDFSTGVVFRSERIPVWSNYELGLTG
jgi:hypothetical protein